MQVMIDETTMALWEFQGRPSKEKEEHEVWSRADIDLMVERVNRGALTLDEKEPGWNYKVHPETLDMADGQLCIVGQTYGSYGQFIGPVFGHPEDTEDNDVAKLAVENGFLTCDMFEAEEYEWADASYQLPWLLMDRVWVYLLKARAEIKQPVTLALPDEEPLEVQLERLLADNLISREAIVAR